MSCEHEPCWTADRCRGARMSHTALVSSTEMSTAFSQRLRDYIELTKPRLSALVLFTTAVGFWLGMRSAQSWMLFLPALIGTSLVVGGANALNEWRERDVDALMQRTKQRPLPSGRLTPDAAFRCGAALSVGGLLLLGCAVNTLSALLAAVSWTSYVLVYTPMKRWTPLCTLVGAIPGALPPVIGWAAARNTLGVEAWALFAILFVWQLPHFLALAVMYREDYARAGFRILPLIESGRAATARQIILYGVTLLPASLFPALIGLTGMWSAYGALLISIAFFVVAAHAAWARSSHSAAQLFRASVLYLPMLLILLVIDRVPH